LVIDGRSAPVKQEETAVLPHTIDSVAQLEALLSEPTPAAVETLSRLDGDLILLGVGGKMGPTLARMARAASDEAGVRRRVIGAARFSTPGLEEQLREHGVETVRCDLLDRDSVRQLPDAANVVWMSGMKFGATGQSALTWAMNTHAPALVCERYRTSRVVAFSTGNVYGLGPVHLGGARESDPLNPVGEYSLSAVGRERIFEHFSRAHGIPTLILRLNYACEMRYGVLADVAQRVWAGQPVSLGMGHFNAIWQGDANAAALCAFAHLETPPKVLNVAGPETLSVRRVAEAFGEMLGRPVTFQGTESPDALLSNAQRAHGLFGYPRVSVWRLMEWVADWVRRGGVTHGKPTHFESREGTF
jgi:nucleoside-diphosphate-sugar epimerase